MDSGFPRESRQVHALGRLPQPLATTFSSGLPQPDIARTRLVGGLAKICRLTTGYALRVSGATSVVSGGDCEIRTHGRLPVGSFQDCWFKPLTQVSAGCRVRILAAWRSPSAPPRLQQPLLLDELDHLIQPLPGLEVGHHERLESLCGGAHAARVRLHHVQVGAHVRGEVGLVDDEEVALGDARAALAGDLLAGGDVDDVDGEVAQLGAEGGCQVVAAAFDEDDVGIGVLREHAVDGLEVDGAVLADGGVRAAAGFHAHDAFGGQGAADGEQALVFLGVDVVGDGDEVVFVAHGLAEHFQDGRLAGADGAADADAQRGQGLGAVRDVVQGRGAGVGGRVHGVMSGKGGNTAFRGGPRARPAWGRRPGAPPRPAAWRGPRRREWPRRAARGCAGRRSGPGARP